MGRVARYKKIKSCDPYSKKNGGRIALDTVGVWGLGNDGRKVKKRSKTAEKMRARKKKKLSPEDNLFDAPPSAGDDFDLADLVGSLKKDKPPVLEPTTSTKTLVKTPVPTVDSFDKTAPVKQDDEQVRAAKLLKLDKQLEQKEDVEHMPLGRMEGESKRAFHKRVKAETRQMIKDTTKVGRKNPEKKKRKKEFLNNKKKRKKGQAYVSNSTLDASEGEEDEEPTGSDTFITGEQAVAARARATAVKFGEQAERPPEFRQLPRGASKKAAKKAGKTSGMNQAQIASEQEAMERVRRKVQAQYASIKSKRRNNGDFHL